MLDVLPSRQKAGSSGRVESSRVEYYIDGGEAEGAAQLALIERSKNATHVVE